MQAMGSDTNANDVLMLEDGPLVDADELEATLGWTLKPQGLCRDETCVIVPDPDAIRRGDQLDVLAIADLLDRPAVSDDASGLVAIGVPRDRRRSALHDQQAPEFVLPDLDGMPVALSDHRSKKRLLVAFASW